MPVINPKMCQRRDAGIRACPWPLEPTRYSTDVPRRALEETVRRWIETGQEVDELLDGISQQCLERFLAKKKEALAQQGKEKPP
jgi:hypothetical protein